jgi:transposase-like protein
MARKQFWTEQIIGMLREAEVRISQGQTIGLVCKGLGISEQSYYRWRRDYGGLKLDQAKRFKDLERGNERLRKAVSELTLDKLILIGELLRENTEPLAPPGLREACALQM